MTENLSTPQFDGIAGKYGLLEDFAHMTSILYVAEKLSCDHYSKVNLCSWSFEVEWGNKGDITPLRYYANNTLLPASRSGVRGSFLAGPGRVGYVRVDDEGNLELSVVQESRDKEEVVLEGCNRTEQQELLFGLGWGPAINVRRSGVLVHILEDDSDDQIGTLVTHPCSDTPVSIKAAMDNGFNDLRFFYNGYYICRDQEGAEVRFCWWL